MSTIDSERTIEEARTPEAPREYTQSEQLRFEVVGETDSNQAESPQDNGVAPTQQSHSAHERQPRIAPGSRGTAVGYIRVSTEDQTQGYSLDAQRAEIERFCERNGYSLDRLYADDGVSAHSDRIENRPQLRALLDDAELKRFDVVIVHTVDRWARNTGVQSQALQRLGTAGVGFVSVTENVDFSTPGGRLLLTVIGGVSEFFSDQLGVHVAKGQHQRAREGLNVGPVPFGYTVLEPGGVASIEPTEADAVRTAFAMSAARRPNGEIARWINSQGLNTRSGRMFTPHSVRDLLRCRFYVGVVTYRGEEFPGKHEALVTSELFERVQVPRRVRRGQGRRSVGMPRGLLSGRLLCVRCRNRLQSDRNRVGNPMYRERHGWECETNGRAFVSSSIDGQIADVLRSLELREDWREHIAQLTAKEAGPSLDELRDRRRRLVRGYADGAFDEDEYEARLRAIDDQLRLAQNTTQVEIDDVAELLGDLSAMWERATSDERRRLIESLIEFAYVDAESKRIVAIQPVPAFRTLLEVAITRTADCSAVLVELQVIGSPESSELVETGENRTPRPASVRHESATGVVGEKISPACLHRRGVGRPAPVILAARPVARLRGCSPALRRRLPVCRAEPGGDVTAWLGGEGEFSFASYGLPPV